MNFCVWAPPSTRSDDLDSSLQAYSTAGGYHVPRKGIQVSLEVLVDAEYKHLTACLRYTPSTTPLLASYTAEQASQQFRYEQQPANMTCNLLAVG